jgi:hypothetical protein
VTLKTGVLEESYVIPDLDDDLSSEMRRRRRKMK